MVMAIAKLKVMPRRRALGQAFRERLAESTRGRASRSRCKSDATTIKAIADYLPTIKRGQSQILSVSKTITYAQTKSV